MGLNSTNPSISTIALQSMSSLHAFRKSSLPRPFTDSLIHKLQDHFCGCFQDDPSETSGYRLISTEPKFLSITDRFSRAVLFFPDQMHYIWGDWERIASFHPPQDFRAAFLLACTLKHKQFLRSREIILKSVIQSVLTLPPIEISKVLPSHRNMYIEAAKTKALDFTSSKWREMAAVLIGRLSPRKELTFQEELLIRYLYTCQRGAGITEEMDEALTKDSDFVCTASFTSCIFFISMLRTTRRDQ